MAILHTIRTRHRDQQVVLTKGVAIRKFCLECMGWVTTEPRRCSDPKCPLYPWRTGKLEKGFLAVADDLVEDEVENDGGDATETDMESVA